MKRTTLITLGTTILLITLGAGCPQPPSKPTASFSPSTTTGTAPLTVQFTDSSSGNGSSITSWLWSFGDGATSTQQSPSHTFTDIGAYPISLTVSNGSGQDTKSNVTITVTSERRLTANFNVAPMQGDLPLTVTFANQSTLGSSNSAITGYHWDFGDNSVDNTSTDANPTHKYWEPGKHTVTLRVVAQNNESNIKSVTDMITVTDPYTQLRAAIEKVGNRPVFVTDDEMPVGIGYGLKLLQSPGSYQFESGGKLFDYQRPGVSVVTGTSDNRYNFVKEQTWLSQYFSSYAEERDFKSKSISAEARYAAYSGGVSWGSEASKYNNSSHHEIGLKVHFDFGWFGLPQNPTLSDAVLVGLRGNGFNAYGTHYARAEHRFAELYINIAADTSFNMSTESMKASADASFNGVATAASLKASMENFRQTLGSSARLTISMTSRGGPAVNLQLANNADLQPMVDAINAWLDPDKGGVTRDNAAVAEFYCRPITDLIPGSAAMGDFLQERSLLNWFTRFNEVDTTLSRIESIITGGNPAQFRQEFSYYGTSLYSPSYYQRLQGTYLTLSDALFTVGQDLLAHPDHFFNANDPRWSAEVVEFPPVSIAIKRWGCNDGGTFDAEYSVTGGDFTNTSRYQITMGDDIGLFVHPLRNADIYGYDAANNLTTCYISAQVTGGSNTPYARAGTGIWLGVRDILTNKWIIWAPVQPGASRVQGPQ